MPDMLDKREQCEYNKDRSWQEGGRIKGSAFSALKTE